MLQGQWLAVRRPAHPCTIVPARGCARPKFQEHVDTELLQKDPVAAALPACEHGAYYQCNFQPKSHVQSAACQILQRLQADRPNSDVREAG